LLELRLPPSVRELKLRDNCFHPAALLGLTPSQAPSLQRITYVANFGCAPMLYIKLMASEPGGDMNEDESPVWLAALEESVGGGALRLISSLRLGREHRQLVPVDASSAALGVLRSSWLPGGQASPPVMELVLQRLICTHAVLAQLPAGLTHLHLEGCSLELDSLLPVAQSLPRLRVLGLDATVSGEALVVLLTSAQQRGALTVHVWEVHADDSDEDEQQLPPEQLSAERVEHISGSAATGMAPLATPQVIWHDWSNDDSADCKATYAAINETCIAIDSAMGSCLL
jgi:hypothetical protein